MDEARFSFSVNVYGNLEKVTETISKARCRIFYKGRNRNGSFITDAFAEKLIKTLPYTPVKGIYDEIEEDYSDHGKSSSQGRIYGIVPQEPNVKWEKHLDDDGVEREYACADVYIYTALYEEAKTITEKPQSMEIYPPSIKGEWKIINGLKSFVFLEGCFLGLQILGEDVEPCFEGAAFFTRIQEAFERIEQIEQAYNLKMGGSTEMDKIILTFKLSDNQKYNAIWSLLNTNFTEEGNWEIKYSICEIYDDYALVRNYENGTYERVYYTKSEDEVTLGEIVTSYIVDVTEEEKTALAAIQAINGGTYNKIDEAFSKLPELETKVGEFETKVTEYENQISDYQAQVETFETEKTNFEQKILEKDETISTLTVERDTATENYNNSVAENASLNSEIETLKEFKLSVETEEKQAILDQYAEKLAPETIEKYTKAMGEFTAVSLKKELAFELVSSDPSIFTKEPDAGYVPKDTPATGIEKLLDKYKK